MEQSTNLKFIKLIGYMSSLMSTFLWVIFIFINPYAAVTNQGSYIISTTMLLLPALLSAVGIALNRSLIVLIAFIWSFPYSLYMLFTPGIFMLFGITSFMYFLCFVLLRFNKNRY